MSKPRGKPFLPGNRFGRGRPKGSQNKRGLELQQEIEQHGPAILRRLVVDALNGKPAAQRLLIERLVPVRREPAVHLNLQRLKDNPDLDLATQRLLKALGSGKLLPAQGAEIASILLQLRSIRSRPASALDDPMPDFIVNTAANREDKAPQPKRDGEHSGPDQLEDRGEPSGQRRPDD